MNDEQFLDNKLITPLKFRYDVESMIQITAEIYSRISMLSDMDEVVETVVSQIHQAFGYDHVALHLLDSERQKFSLKVQANVNQPEATQSYAFENFASLAHRAVRRRSVICIGNIALESPGYQQPAHLNIHSECHIPLEYDADILGVLSLGSAEKYVFDDSNIVTVLKILAAQISVTINRACQNGQEAKLHAEDKNYSQVVGMQDFSPKIQLLTGGIYKVFDKIVRGIVKGLDYSVAMLAVVNEEDQTLSVRAVAYSNLNHYQNRDVAENFFGEQIVGNSVSLAEDRDNLGVQTCLSGETKITRNLYDLFYPVVNEELSRRIQKGSQINTCVAIPLKVDNTVMGSMYVGTCKDGFSLTDLETLHFFVSNATIAVQTLIYFEHVSQELMLRKTELGQLRRVG